MASTLTKIITGAGAVAVAGILFTTLRAGGSDGPQPKDAAAARRQAAPPPGAEDVRAPLKPAGWVAGQGIVEPVDREVKLGAPQAGLVRRVFVREGEGVKKGDPLVELDDLVERAAVEAAQADLQAAKVQLARAQEAKRPEDRAAAVADAQSAKARAALSLASEKRQAALAAKGAATPDELDRAHYQAEIDTASADAQLARADAARRGWERDVQVSAAQVAQAGANLAQAQAKLERLTVRAPKDGTVLQVFIREGEYYNPGTGSLVTLGDLSRIRFRMDVDERDVAQARVGQRGYVTVDAQGDRRSPGTVVEVGRRMGRKNLRTDEPTERIDTKILEVVLELDDGHQLVQGQRGTGFLEVGSAPTVSR